MARRKIAVVAALGAAWCAQAKDTQLPYPTMAPLDQYLMPDQSAQIALARSAAPESISHDAEITILGRHGYVTAERGRNEFICVVERS
jgi:predicted transcriptional regulator